LVPNDYASGFSSEEEAAKAAWREAEIRMHALLESAAFTRLECESAITHGDIWIGLALLCSDAKRICWSWERWGAQVQRSFFLDPSQRRQCVSHFGSIAHKVVTHARCPVLTVRRLPLAQKEQ
jgi:hypothetical protein